MKQSTCLYSYRFGRFELQPSERRLLAAGVPAVVEARAFDVLVALVERARHLVTKEELFSLVWPKLIVEDTNLHVQVSALRKILGPAAIATVPGLWQIAYCCGPAETMRAGCERTSQRCCMIPPVKTIPVSGASMSNKSVNKGYCKRRFEPLAMARYVKR